MSQIENYTLIEEKLSIFESDQELPIDLYLEVFDFYHTEGVFKDRILPAVKRFMMRIKNFITKTIPNLIRRIFSRFRQREVEEKLKDFNSIDKEELASLIKSFQSDSNGYLIHRGTYRFEKASEGGSRYVSFLENSFNKIEAYLNGTEEQLPDLISVKLSGDDDVKEQEMLLYFTPAGYFKGSGLKIMIDTGWKSVLGKGDGNVMTSGREFDLNDRASWFEAIIGASEQELIRRSELVAKLADKIEEHVTKIDDGPQLFDHEAFAKSLLGTDAAEAFLNDPERRQQELEKKMTEYQAALYRLSTRITAPISEVTRFLFEATPQIDKFLVELMGQEQKESVITERKKTDTSSWRFPTPDKAARSNLSKDEAEKCKHSFAYGGGAMWCKHCGWFNQPKSELHPKGAITKTPGGRKGEVLGEGAIDITATQLDLLVEYKLMETIGDIDHIFNESFFTLLKEDLDELRLIVATESVDYLMGQIKSVNHIGKKTDNTSNYNWFQDEDWFDESIIDLHPFKEFGEELFDDVRGYLCESVTYTDGVITEGLGDRIKGLWERIKRFIRFLIGKVTGLINKIRGKKDPVSVEELPVDSGAVKAEPSTPESEPEKTYIVQLPKFFNTMDTMLEDLGIGEVELWLKDIIEKSHVTDLIRAMHAISENRKWKMMLESISIKEEIDLYQGGLILGSSLRNVKRMLEDLFKLSETIDLAEAKMNGPVPWNQNEPYKVFTQTASSFDKLFVELRRDVLKVVTSLSADIGIVDQFYSDHQRESAVTEATETLEYNTDLTVAQAKRTLGTLSSGIIEDSKKVSQYTANIYANIITKNLLPAWSKDFKKLSITIGDTKGTTVEFVTPKMTQDFVARFVAGHETFGKFLRRSSEIKLRISPKVFSSMTERDDAYHFFKGAIRYYDSQINSCANRLMSEVMKLGHNMKHLISNSKMSGLVTYPLSLLLVFDGVDMSKKDTFRLSAEDIKAVNSFVRNIATNYASPEKEKREIVKDVKELVDELREFVEGGVGDLTYLPEAVDNFYTGGFDEMILESSRQFIEACIDRSYRPNPETQLIYEKFGVKKLKKIPRDLVAYIQIETEAIKDANDKMMISSYCLGKIEIVEWYIELLEVGSKKYIVPHNRPYLEMIRTQLLACFKQIMDTKISNPADRPIIDIRYPKGYEG